MRPRMIDGGQLQSVLAQTIARSGLSLNAWAKANGFFGSYVSEVANGHKPPSKKLLRILGYEKAVLFRKLPVSRP